MTIFERVLGGTIFYDFWKQVQEYLFSEDRFIQLITLKPIEIYKTETDLEIDTAKVHLSIKSNVENLMQRRIERTINLLTLNRTENYKDGSAYNFDVVIKAFMTYEDVSRFFNHHFGNQTYTIDENKYYLTVEHFTFSSEGSRVVVHLPFTMNASLWKFKYAMKGTAVLKGFINYHQPKYVVKTRNLNYELETDSSALKWIDHYYHEKLVDFLTQFLQYNFREELFHAKTEAQVQINSLETQTSWISGNINELDLERMTIEPDGVHGVFLAEGKLYLMR